MKKKNFIFCLAVFTVILLVTAMLYLYINRHQDREKPSPLTGSDRPAVAITFDDGPDAEYTPGCWTIYTGTMRRPHFSLWEKIFLKTNCW